MDHKRAAGANIQTVLEILFNKFASYNRLFDVGALVVVVTYCTM